MIDLSACVVPQKCDIPQGAVGVWQIPELDIIIPVYAKGRKTEQQIINDEDSSAYVRWMTAYQIADHYDSKAGRGKWRIDKVRPLMIAFFVKPNETLRYECYRTCVADVKAYGLYTINGIAVTPYSSRDIMCNCCVGSDNKRNFLAVFRYLGRMP